jgi:hypothetical protein
MRQWIILPQERCYIEFAWKLCLETVYNDEQTVIANDILFERDPSSRSSVSASCVFDSPHRTNGRPFRSSCTT